MQLQYCRTYKAWGFILISLLVSGCSSWVNPKIFAPTSANNKLPSSRTTDCTDYTPTQCQVSAVGDLRFIPTDLTMTWWTPPCRCQTGMANGRGSATWCGSASNKFCNDESESGLWFGTVVGNTRDGKFYDSVVMKTPTVLFKGDIYEEGTYKLGTLIMANEKFIGEFDTQGNYQSGTLYNSEGITYIADKFSGNKPIGTVLAIFPNGRYQVQNCSITTCKVEDEGISKEGAAFSSEMRSFVASKLTDQATRLMLKSLLRGLFRTILNRSFAGIAVQITMAALKV